MDDKPTLYIVPTPIGNLKDVSLRSVDILKTVEIILAEDVRISKKLLFAYEITKPLVSYHQHNEHLKIKHFVNLILENKKVALISDAGTPGISDAGYLLVNACIKNNILVQTLPGPTALIPALVNSGLPCEQFVFEGFLPPKKKRNSRLKLLENEKRTMIFYESPYRLVKTLIDFANIFGKDRSCSISREISKIFEETTRGTLEELITHFQSIPARGEFVICLKGADIKRRNS